MKKMPIFLVIALAGCATRLTPGQLMARAMIQPTQNLCATLLLSSDPDVLKAAQDEITSRHATCDWEQAKAIAEVQIEKQQAAAEQERNERAARMANAAALMSVSGALLQQSRPQPVQPAVPTTTNCHQMGAYWNCTSY
jgi:hypothetical protein